MNFSVKEVVEQKKTALSTYWQGCFFELCKMLLPKF